jgi:hypothetical protein
MAEALANAGKPHDLLLLDPAAPDASEQALRLRFYRNLEAFLYQHLGASPSP